MLRVICFCGFALAAALLAGCGVPLAEPTASPPATPTVAAAGEATTTPVTSAIAGGPSGLAGLVLSASDVAGQPDTPLAEQLVVAVALPQADAALSLGGQPLTTELLRFLKAPLPAGDPALVTTLSDGQGQYSFALAPGSYVVCLADATQLPPALPATTRGCGQVEVPAGRVQQADLSSGFGEVLLIPR